MPKPYGETAKHPTLPFMISAGRLWWLLRRDLRRGWDATRHHYWTLPKITEWAWDFEGQAQQEISVHVLTGQEDWLLAAWMLASWFHFSEQSWPVVLHDDGSLPKDARETLLRLFKNVRFISRQEADSALETALKPYPFCHEYRDMHPLGLKIFDIPHFARGSRYLMFDSDVLFFSHPREILDWVVSGKDECWFNEDVAESSLLSAEEARQELEVNLWPRVNSGLGLLSRAAIDLDFCDRALAQTAILRRHIWRVEQTLYALCASRYNRGGLLPKRYEVSLRKWGNDEIASRHYVGAVRDRFYGEGLQRLTNVLLAREA